MHRLTTLSVFLFMVVLAVAVSGHFVGGEWYQAMKQPPWNPPAIMMASLWSISFVLMALSAWMAWDAGRGLAQAGLAWWGLQLILAVVWSWMFYGLHRPGWSLGVMGLWLLAALVTTIIFRPIRQEAYRLMVPVVVWLMFALALNFTQWLMNGGGLSSFL